MVSDNSDWPCDDLGDADDLNGNNAKNQAFSRCFASTKSLALDELVQLTPLFLEAYYEHKIKLLQARKANFYRLNWPQTQKQLTLYLSRLQPVHQEDPWLLEHAIQWLESQVTD